MLSLEADIYIDYNTFYLIQYQGVRERKRNGSGGGGGDSASYLRHKTPGIVLEYNKLYSFLLKKYII